MLLSMFSMAWILGIGLLGPLLALPKRYRIPVAFGEILVGVLFGKSGLDLVPTGNPTFSLFASIGFALVMMITGSTISLPKILNAATLRIALTRQAIVLLVAVPVALGIDWATGVHHVAIFVVLLTSSSAALVLPVITSLKDGVSSHQISTLITQASLADLLSILAIPLVLNRKAISGVIVGSIVVTASAAVFGLLIALGSKRGITTVIRRISKQRHFGLELRFSLILLLTLGAIAIHFSVSVMIAGFALGLALSAGGLPHRLAQQLFAVSEGLFAPFFFVWLGAEIDVRVALRDHHLLLLTLLLTLGSWLAHASAKLLGQPLKLAFLASTQLGVPVAVVAIGQSTRLISSGQAGAIMLAALLTIVGSVLASLSFQSRES